MRVGGSLCAVVVCHRRDSGLMAPLLLGFEHAVLSKGVDGSTRLSSQWRRRLQSSTRGWSGLAVEKLGWFGSTKVLPAIHGVDEAADIAWLSFNEDAFEWVDVGEELWMALAVWGKGCGWFPCAFRLPWFGGSMVVLVT